MSKQLFRKALVPVNASDLSERVIDQAAELMKSGLVETMVLLSVWDADEIDYTKLHALEKEEKLKKMARDVLAKYKKQLKDLGLEVDARLAEGEPSEVILNVVKNYEFDLIIMGGRKLNKFQELVFGSVSDRVTRLSSVPVFIVK